MSYSVYLYNPSVREEVERGQNIDAFAHPGLDRAAVAEFLIGLERAGYKSSLKSVERAVFKKPVGDSLVEVNVFDTEISFSVAGSDEAALFEALQDAAELRDTRYMALLNPQSGGWQDD